MGILSWVVFGLVVGALAKWVLPGGGPRGWIITTLLGVGGAMLGGYLGTRLGWGTVAGFDIKSLGLSVGGAIVLLLGYQALTGSR